MGMFSTLIVDNQEIQFKTGNDQCDVFHVGDRVPFKVKSDRAGDVEFPDCVYLDSSESWWIVIKDHRIAAYIPCKTASVENLKTIGDLAQIGDKRRSEFREIMERFSISEDYPHEWWTDAAWEEKRIGDEERERQEKNREKAYLQATGRDARECPFGFYLWCKMREPSFSSLAFGTPSIDPETRFEKPPPNVN